MREIASEQFRYKRTFRCETCGARVKASSNFRKAEPLFFDSAFDRDLDLNLGCRDVTQCPHCGETDSKKLHNVTTKSVKRSWTVRQASSS